MRLFSFNEGPNGGDPVAQEFVALGNEIVKELNTKQYKSLNLSLSLKKSELSQLISSEAKVFSKPKVYLQDGTEVSAINYMSRKLIIVGSDRWKAYDISHKLGLVMHEYLSLLGHEINRYDVSIEFFDVFLSVKQLLIEKRSKDIKYYTSQTAIPPLYERSSLCSLDASYIEKIKNNVVQNAVNKCIIDTQRRCVFSKFHIYTVELEDKNIPWLSGCRLEGVAVLE